MKEKDKAWIEGEKQKFGQRIVEAIANHRQLDHPGDFKVVDCPTCGHETLMVYRCGDYKCLNCGKLYHTVVVPTHYVGEEVKEEAK